MNRYLDVKIFLIAFSVTALLGCTVPEPRVAPTPTPQQLAQKRQVQVREIAIPVESVFPVILDVLMDNGFIVRSVNEKSSFVSFFQQWSDGSQRNANITLEGSLLFKAVSLNSTQVKVALTGSWQLLSLGGANASNSMVSGVQQNPSAEQYARVLDVVERGLMSDK